MRRIVSFFLLIQLAFFLVTGCCPCPQKPAEENKPSESTEKAPN